LEDSLRKKIEIGTVNSISFRSLQLTNFLIFENSSTKEEKILFQAENAEAKFNFIFSLFYWKEWLLDIRDITFYQASTTITREITGEFDFIRKLQLEPEEIEQNLIIRRINFKDSYLVYHDELVYNYDLDYLTTRAKNIDGYFDLSQLPKIGFEFQGIQEKDNALLALQGEFSIDQPEYSLDFHLENADITHFQYYLEVAELFKVSQGKFNIDFNLRHNSDSPPSEIDWKGEATFQQTDLNPQFLQEIPFRQMSGSMQFVNPEITISEMTGLYGDKNVQLKGSVLTFPEVYFDFDIKSDELNAAYLKEDISLFLPDYNDFSLEGELAFSGNVKGQPENFQIEGKAFSSEIIFENIPFQETDCSFLLRQNELIIESLETHELESYLSANGKIDWSEDVPFYQFSLETENLSLQHSLFNQLTFLEGSSGTINSNLQIESQKQDISIVSIVGPFSVNSIEIEGLSLLDPLQGNITSTMDFSDQRLSIQRCELESGQNQGFIKGEVNFDELVQFRMDFGFQLPELTELANSMGLEIQPVGRADIEGTFYGNSKQPEIKAGFNLQELSIQDNMLGELTGELIVQQNIISLETVELINQDTKLTGNGKIILQENNSPEIDFSYQLHTIDIDPLIQTITDDIPLSGLTNGSGQIEGIWPKLAIQGNFQLEQIAFKDYLIGQGQFDFHLQPEQELLPENEDNHLIELFSWLGHSYSFELDNLKLENENMKIKAEGQSKIRKDYPFSLEIEFVHQALSKMIDYFYPDDEVFKIFLPSQITGKVNLQGDISEQNIGLSAMLTSQQQENNPPSQLTSMITINDDGWLLSDFSLIQTEGQFNANGSLSATQALDIEFQAERLDMNALMNLAQIDEEIQGIMDIEGFCSGTIDQPQISMTAQIEKGYFREFQFEDFLGNFLWNSQKNEIEIRKLDIALEDDNHIQAKGNLPLDVFMLREEPEIESEVSEIVYQEIPLDFQINMKQADLNLLRLFWKEAFSEIMGNIDLELYLAGTTENPVINGTIDINQGKIAMNNLPIQVEEINSRIEISNNQVNIPNIPLMAYENRFNLSGQFEMVHLVPENISLTIQNDEEKIIYQNIVETRADFWAEIRGSLLEPDIDAKLVLSEGNLNLQNLLQLVEESNVSSSNDTARYDSSESYLDLNIEIADPFTLKLPDAEINISGNINLNGSFAEPTVNGNLNLKKGYLIYFEKRFVISEGRVTINGLTINEIDITAKANTTVQDVKIEINISGNLANPQISLSSQPSLRETEIISLLTFNRNIQGLSEGEINQILSQEMVDIIFQSLQINLFRRMERELAEGLGFEFIRLSYDVSEGSTNNRFFLEDINLGDLTLEVGRSISDDVFVTYSAPLDFQGETSLGIDYEISSAFTFSTQFDTYSLKEEDYRFKFGLEFRF